MKENVIFEFFLREFCVCGQVYDQLFKMFYGYIKTKYVLCLYENLIHKSNTIKIEIYVIIYFVNPWSS